MTNNEELKAKYQAAFDSFLEKVKADDTIIAAYLYGSLARGDVWEKSDLDVYLVTKDERREAHTFALVEDDITFHCDVFSRSRFRRIHERLLDCLNGLVESGHTVVVIEHNLEVIKCADHVIDLGPEGGSQGGYVIAQSSPEEVAGVRGSYTGEYLARVLEGVAVAG